MSPPHGLCSLDSDDTSLGRRPVGSMLFSVNVAVAGWLVIVVIVVAGFNMDLRRDGNGLRRRMRLTDADSILEHCENRGSHYVYRPRVEAHGREV